MPTLNDIIHREGPNFEPGGLQTFRDDNNTPLLSFFVRK